MATRDELHSWLRALYEGDAADGKVALAVCIYISQPLIATVSTILAMRCEDVRMPPMTEPGMQVILSRTPYWCPRNLDDKFLCPVLSFGVQLTHMMRAEGKDLYLGGMNDMADMAGAHMFAKDGDGHLPIMTALDFTKRLAKAIHRADERSRRFDGATFTVDSVLCLLEETRDLLTAAKDAGGPPPSPSPSPSQQPPSSSSSSAAPPPPPRAAAPSREASSSPRAEPSREPPSSRPSSSSAHAAQPRRNHQEEPRPDQRSRGGSSSSGAQEEGPSSGSSSSGRNCRICGASSTLRCSMCGEAKYCSRACQKGDWRRHKDECRSAGKAPARDDPGAPRQQQEEEEEEHHHRHQQQRQQQQPQGGGGDNVPMQRRDGLMTIVGPPLIKEWQPAPGPREA